MRRPTTMMRLITATLIFAVAATAAFAQAGAAGDARGPSTRLYELTVLANIRGADVYLDGVRQRETTPATFRLRPGVYRVRVEARGYESWEETVTLRTGDVTVRANLVPPTATVILEIPSTYLNDRVRDPWRLIDLYIDGVLRNEARVEVEPGYRDVTIVSGGLAFESEFFFEAGREYTLELILRLALFQDRR